MLQLCGFIQLETATVRHEEIGSADLRMTGVGVSLFHDILRDLLTGSFYFHHPAAVGIDFADVVGTPDEGRVFLRVFPSEKGALVPQGLLGENPSLCPVIVIAEAFE